MTPNPENPDPGPNAPRILVVVDDPVDLQVVRNILGLEGMVVTVAAGGLEALTLMEAGEAFDLVLLDVMVPGMAGFELCREIRRRHNHDELPVLMLADKKRLPDLIEGLKSGANDCLGKPFAREEMLARVSAQLKVREAHEMARENNRLRCELELRVQTELALRLGHRRLEGMLHAFPQAMVAINGSREIAFCTRVFAERFGYRAHDLFGKSAQTLFGVSAETLETWFAVLENPEAVLPAGGAFLLLVAADGKPWPGRVVPAALKLENEHLLLLLLDETPSVAASLRRIHD
ncbi:MAG: response regulator, partial [Proteobacteria bacterium]|nr:response regulator [Pseudomonadota bacterium]